MTMAATNGDDNRSTTSTSSRVSFFGLNQCPTTEKLRGMKDDLNREMDGCRQLFDIVMTTVENTNDYDDAALESDSARDGFCDMVYDYIGFARQVAINATPGDPLRFAASSL